MARIPDLTITSLEMISVFDIATGAYKFTLDELQSSSIAQSEETTEITGKRGRRISTLKRNKAVTISGSNGLVSAGLLGVQTGASFTNGNAKVQWVDNITTTTADEATTTYKAVGTAGSEIIGLFVKNSDGTLGTEYTQASAVASGKFTYTPGTKKIQFDSSAVPVGTELVVFYKRQIVADVLASDIDTYATKCQVYIDAIAEDKCGNVYHVQIDIPKADFSGNFTLEFGDSQTVHDFEINALAGGCSGSNDLFKITIFPGNASDAA